MVVYAVVDSPPIAREMIAAEACSRRVVGSLGTCSGMVSRESREGSSSLLGNSKDL